eukprot:gene7928-10761_t
MIGSNYIFVTLAFICLITTSSFRYQSTVLTSLDSFSPLVLSSTNSPVISSQLEQQSSQLSPNGAVTVLKCDGLSKSYTGVPQFNSISLNLGKGQRVGLIGVNGAGKSTLLRCLAKIDSADSGMVEFASNCNVIYVDQEPEWGNIKVFEALFSGSNPEAKASRLYYNALTPDKEMDNDEFSLATDAMEESNAWDYQTRGVNIAEKLNINSEKMYRDVSTLSGGEKKRVGLSAALLKQPDVLLLDEPTNHLDIDALDWLADYLKPGGKDRDMAMLLVTHDRYFLERVCSEIVELDKAAVYRYPGNYGRYLELKEARIAAEDAEAMRARTKLRRESEWMAKQPRARQAKSKARQDQFYELVERAKSREVTSKIEFASPEEKEKQKRLGGVVAEFRAARYLMGDRTLLSDFTYNFRQRDRIGVVGPNGVGKSTFLKVLTGMLPLSSGTVRIGETVRVGYYEQTGLNITADQENQPVLRFVQEAVDKNTVAEKVGSVKAPTPVFKVEEGGNLGRRKMLAGKEAVTNVQLQESSGSGSSAFSEREAMSLLSRFQFPSKRWYDRVGQLSGGERRRLQLLQILARNPNVLLLDEPSNDLDLSTLSALEEYLTEVFDGCLVVVSHDNFFVNRVAEHLFVFEGDGIVRDFQGSYSDYLEYRRDVAIQKREESAAIRKSATATAGTSSVSQKEEKKSEKKIENNNEPKKQPSSPLSFNERKEMNKLEKEIEKLTSLIVEIESKIAVSSKKNEGFSVLAELTSQKQVVSDQLAVKEEKWLSLAERSS